MLTGDEISRSTHAAVALFRGDAQGLRELDVSYDGFWRSFQVFFLLLPFMGVLILSQKFAVMTQLPLVEETFPSRPFVISRLIGFAVDWVAYPIFLALLARPLGLTRRYVPLIVALNWASLVAAVPAVIPHLLMLLGVIGPQIGEVLNLVMLVVVLRYEYMVTRIATGGPAPLCAGLVALDSILSIAVMVAAASIAGI